MIRPYPTTPPQIIRVSDNVWSVYGNPDLQDLEETAGIVLDSEDCDTFTAMCSMPWAWSPDDGVQNIKLELPHLLITVSRIEEHQIAEATIEIKPPVEKPEKEEEKK